MDNETESMFDRAKELTNELEEEYNQCLKNRDISERSKNLIHEILEKLRNILDQKMWLFWEKHLAVGLSEKERKAAKVYFPITENTEAFLSTLGRAMLRNLEERNKKAYDFLIGKQVFSSKENNWLVTLKKIVNQKHIRLVPQQWKETTRVTVSGSGGRVSWDPSSVKFGTGVRVMGAPIDPSTQRIIPTQGVSEREERWVSFLLEDYKINALGFCKETYEKVHKLVEEFNKII